MRNFKPYKAFLALFILNTMVTALLSALSVVKTFAEEPDENTSGSFSAFAIPKNTEGSHIQGMHLLKVSQKQFTLALMYTGEGFDPIIHRSGNSESGYTTRLTLENVRWEGASGISRAQQQMMLMAQFKQLLPQVTSIALDGGEAASGSSAAILTIRSAQPLSAVVQINSQSRVEIALAINTPSRLKARSIQNADVARDETSSKQKTIKGGIAGLAAAFKSKRLPRTNPSPVKPVQEEVSQGDQNSPTEMPVAMKLPKISGIYKLELDPTTEPGLKQAWQAYRQGNYTETIQYLKGYVTSHPQRQDARHLMAAAYLGQNDKPKAIELLESLTSGSSPYLPAMLDLLTLRIESGSWYLSDTLVKKALAQWPDHPDIRFYSGFLNEAQNKLDIARQEYVRALIVSPNHPFYHYRLAMVELKSQRNEAAQVELERVLMVNPDNTDALKLKAYLANKTNDRDKTKQYYQLALRPDGMISYAGFLQETGQSEQARQLLKTALILAPGDADVWYNVGMMLAAQKDWEEAKLVMKQYLKLSAISGPDASKTAQANQILKQQN